VTAPDDRPTVDAYGFPLVPVDPDAVPARRPWTAAQQAEAAVDWAAWGAALRTRGAPLGTRGAVFTPDQRAAVAYRVAVASILAAPAEAMAAAAAAAAVELDPPADPDALAAARADVRRLAEAHRDAVAAALSDAGHAALGALADRGTP
jgi:hypothetical protein